MKTAVFTFVLFLSLFARPESAMCAERDSKLVTRIETASVVMKRGRLSIRVTAMATGRGLMPGGGRLVRRNPDHQPNKDGLLEYNLVYNAPTDYSGFKLKPVNATLKEDSVPPGVQGVRIFAEFNHLDAKPPEPKKKK